MTMALLDDSAQSLFRLRSGLNENPDILPVVTLRCMCVKNCRQVVLRANKHKCLVRRINYNSNIFILNSDTKVSVKKQEMRETKDNAKSIFMATTKVPAINWRRLTS